MKKTVCNYTYRKIIWGSLISLFAFASVFASDKNDLAKVSFNSESASKLIVKNLTNMLKTDLVQEKVAVELKTLEQSRATGYDLTVKGNANCVLEAEKTQLPITFEAKINLTTQAVEDIKYTFVEAEESAYAPTSEEEILMRELMTQISRDYKTQEIVISIDSFETVNSAENLVEYKGLGEVRIGTLGWSKINFDVKMNQNKTAENVAYSVK